MHLVIVPIIFAVSMAAHTWKIAPQVSSVAESDQMTSPYLQFPPPAKSLTLGQECRIYHTGDANIVNCANNILKVDRYMQFLMSGLLLLSAGLLGGVIMRDRRNGKEPPLQAAPV